MKRARSNEEVNKDKKIKKSDLIKTFTQFRKKRDNSSSLIILIEDNLREILKWLPKPWRWTLKYALTGKRPAINSFTEDAYEVVKYGSEITKYFYEENMISIKQILLNAAYYGNLELMKEFWGKKRGPGKVLYKCAAFGGQSHIITYLHSFFKPDYDRVIRPIAIFSGHTEILGERLIDRTMVCSYAQLDIYLKQEWVPKQIDLWNAISDLPNIPDWTEYSFYPPEIIEMRSLASYEIRLRKFITYFNSCGIRVNQEAMDEVSNLIARKILSEMGLILNDSVITHLIDEKHNEEIKRYIVEHAHFSQTGFDQLMRCALIYDYLWLLQYLHINHNLLITDSIIDVIIIHKKDILLYILEHGQFSEEGLKKLLKMAISKRSLPLLQYVHKNNIEINDSIIPYLMKDTKYPLSEEFILYIIEHARFSQRGLNELMSVALSESCLSLLQYLHTMNVSINNTILVNCQIHIWLYALDQFDISLDIKNKMISHLKHINLLDNIYYDIICGLKEETLIYLLDKATIFGNDLDQLMNIALFRKFPRLINRLYQYGVSLPTFSDIFK